MYTKTELLCFTHETKYNIIFQFSLNGKKKKRNKTVSYNNHLLRQPGFVFLHIPQAGGSQSVVLRPSQSEWVGQASCVITGCPNDSDAPSGLGTPATDHTIQYINPVISHSKVERSTASSLNTFKKRTTSRSCSKLVQAKAQQAQF